jgi:hypothetical protein
VSLHIPGGGLSSSSGVTVKPEWDRGRTFDADCGNLFFRCVGLPSTTVCPQLMNLFFRAVSEASTAVVASVTSKEERKVGVL